LGEALCRKSFKKPDKLHPDIETNPVERVSQYLKTQKMVVDTVLLIELHHQGLHTSDAGVIRPKCNRNGQER
jgi:hypothetical protein